MKKCPYCAEEIQDEALVCRYCGRDFRPKGRGCGYVLIGIGAILGIIQCIVIYNGTVAIFAGNNYVLWASIEWFVITIVGMAVIAGLYYLLGKNFHWD